MSGSRNTTLDGKGKNRDKRSASMGASSAPLSRRKFPSEEILTIPKPSVIPARSFSPQSDTSPQITSSTTLTFMLEEESYTSSEQTSPGRESGNSPGRELSPISESRRDRRVSNSPRRFLVSSKGSHGSSATFYSGASANSSPRSPHSSPRAPQGSPESGYKSGDSGSPRLGSSYSLEKTAEDMLPISLQDTIMQRNAAKERFAKEGSPIEGHSYLSSHRLATGAVRTYPIVVTSSVPLGSFIYLIDMNAKLGGGAAGDTYICYDLGAEKKMAVKFFKSNVLPELAIREANNLHVAGDLQGFFCGNLNQEKVFAVFMPLVRGETLSDYMHIVDAKLKEAHPNYKDMAAYFSKKKKFPYIDRIDIIITAAQALQRLHNAGLVHRDISADNYILSSSQEGRFIDLETAVNVATDLYCMTQLPEKMNLINSQSIESIKNKTGASYIRYGQQLFYLHRGHNKLGEVKLSPEQLRRFDEKMQPSLTPKTLSLAELQEVTLLTGHQQLAPVYEGVNVAYGFASPEHSVSFESDYYMFAILAGNTASGFNLMKLLKEDYARKIAEQNTDNSHPPTIDTDEVKTMMPDVFNERYARKSGTVEDYVYHAFVITELRVLLNSMLSQNPKLRLHNSSFSKFIEKVIDLRDDFIKLSEGYKLLVDGLVVIQKFGVLLPNILSVIQESHQQPDKQSYLFKKVDELLNINSGISVTDNSGDSLLLAMQRLTKQSAKRQKLLVAILGILEGWGKIKYKLPDPELIKPLLKDLCPNGVAAFEFLQKLPFAMDSRAQSERKLEGSIGKALK